MPDDADPAAASGEALPPNAHPYVHALRLHRGGRGFVALCRKPGTDGRPVDTRCFEGPELFTHLPPPNAAGEHFISVNTFTRPQRRIEHLLSLRACFIDLDFLDLPIWANATAEQIWVAVQSVLAEREVPHPTMVVASGRGLHLYWIFPQGLSKDVLPRWNAVQRHLCEMLKTSARQLSLFHIELLL